MPLNIISVSFAAASIVILPELVVKLIAASPTEISSAALEAAAAQLISVPSEVNTVSALP